MAATAVQSKPFSSSVVLGDNGEVVVEHTSNGHFATVTINRPEVHNALSPGVMDGLESALNLLEEDKKVRAVFLKAEGKTFCAGGDLKHMKSTADWHTSKIRRKHFACLGYSIRFIVSPVIAMINGPPMAEE